MTRSKTRRNFKAKPLVAITWLEDGARILSALDETGRPMRIFLTRKHADALIRGLRETHAEMSARLELAVRSLERARAESERAGWTVRRPERKP